MRVRVAMALAAILTLVQTSAGEAAVTGEEWVRMKVAIGLRAGDTLATVEAKMARYFDAADLELKGVSRESYKRLKDIKRAERRALEISRVLAFDLNGDGVVTREELEIGLTAEARKYFQDRGLPEPTREQILAERDKLMRTYLSDDFRKDGRITLDDMRRAADMPGPRVDEDGHLMGDNDWEPPQSNHVPFDLSTHGDGVVTREDYAAAIRRAFDSFNTNHDGLVTEDEVQVAKASVNDIEARENAEDNAERLAKRFAGLLLKCGIPTASEQAVVDRVSAIRVTAMTNITLNEPGFPAGAADVIVPPGTAPVYLALDSAQPVLWRVQGAVQRVEAVVLGGWAAGKGDAAVAGVPREKVKFIRDPECFIPLAQAEGDTADKVFELAFGKVPETTVSVARVGVVQLDGAKNDATRLLSGAQGMPESTRARFAWSYFLQVMPGGLVRVDPTAIVAQVTPKLLPLAPGGAGIAELADMGAIDPVGQANFLSITDEKARQDCFLATRAPLPDANGGSRPQDLCVSVSPEKYVIRRAITFPLAMNTRVYHFELPRDVPKPEGNLRADVVWQDTGEPVFPPQPPPRRLPDPHTRNPPY